MKVDTASDAYNGQITGYCKDCTVLAAQAEIAFENGTIADLSHGVYSHHIMLTMAGKPPVGMPVSTTCKGKATGGFGNPTPPKLAQLGSKSSSGSGKSSNNLLKSLLSKGKPLQIPSPFIVNGGDGSSVEFAVRKNSGSNVKSGYAIPKDATMTFFLEEINYNDHPKDLFLSLDYEYLPKRPTGYMDMGMGAINFDGCPGVLICTFFLAPDFYIKSDLICRARNG